MYSYWRGTTVHGYRIKLVNCCLHCSFNKCTWMTYFTVQAETGISDESSVNDEAVAVASKNDPPIKQSK